jgi:hypothetical protein
VSIPYPSNSVTETLITAIDNLGGPPPTSYGLGELLRDFDNALEDFTGGGGGGTPVIRSTSATVGLDEYSLYIGPAGQTLTLPVPSAKATNVVKNDSNYTLAVGPNVAGGFFGYIALNPGESAWLTYIGGTWFPLGPQYQLSQPVLNVVNYGADDSGSTDSTGSIQAAITECGELGGGIVYFPPGIYLISSTLNVGNGVAYQTAVAAGSSGTTLNVTSTAAWVAAGFTSGHLSLWQGSSNPVVVTFTGISGNSFTGVSSLAGIANGQGVTSGKLSTANNIVLAGPALQSHSVSGALGFGAQCAKLKWSGSGPHTQMVVFNGPMTGGGIKNLYADCSYVANGFYSCVGLQAGVFENVFCQDYYANAYIYTGITQFYSETQNLGVAGDSMGCRTTGWGGQSNVTGQNLSLLLATGENTAPSPQSPNYTYSFMEDLFCSLSDPGSGFTTTALYLQGCDNIIIRGGNVIGVETPAGTVNAVVFDFSYFGGFTPESCMIDGLNGGQGPSDSWGFGGSPGGGDPNIVTNTRGGQTIPAGLTGIYADYVKWLSDTVNGNYVAEGGAWSAYTPTWTSTGTAPTIGNGSIVGYYQKIGQVVNVRIEWAWGSTTSLGTGFYVFSLPYAGLSGASQTMTTMLNDSTSEYPGSAVIAAGAEGFVRPYSTKSGASGSQIQVEASNIGTGILLVQGTYQSET